MKFIQFSILFMFLALAGKGFTQDAPSLPGRGMQDVSQEDIKPLTSMCESCHGVGGQSSRDDVPSIAGKSSKLIMNSLEQFYYGERHCPDVQFKNYNGEMETKNMCDITNSLTKPEGLALAEYFENQKVPAKKKEK